VSVTEGDTAYRPCSEAAGTFTTFREEGEFRITWYHPYTSNDTRTFTIAYTVKGGLRLYDGVHQRVVVDLAEFKQRAESKASQED